MASETELDEGLKSENEEYRKLCEEHEDLKKQVRDLEHHKLHTPEQEAEISRLKKLKLKGKDRMHFLLSEHRRKSK